MKYVELVRKSFGKQSVFSMQSLRTLLAKKGISKGYSNLLVHNLLKKGELHKIAKGIYSFQSDPMIAGFAFSPFYYGLQEALSLRNLWEQETNPIVLTPKKVRTGTREILGSNVLVRHIGRKMFFGFELIKYYDTWIPVSDPEKTLIDFVYFNEPLSKEALQEIKAKISAPKLEQYLKKCGKKTRQKTKKIIQG